MSQKSDKLPSRALMIFITGVILFLAGLIFFMISPIVALIMVIAGGALAVWGFRLDQQDRRAAKQQKASRPVSDSSPASEEGAGRKPSADARGAQGSFRPSEPLPEDILDDITYIKEMQHHSSGPWHRYDVMLDAGNYSWQDMLNWADYMALSDLSRISTITSAEYIGAVAAELIASYDENTTLISELPGLAREQGVLAIGGISNVLQSPVKICWYNQTRALCLFSLTPDEDLMTRYIETMIRRTFDTVDAMKRAKPQPAEDAPAEEQAGEPDGSEE